MKFNVLACFQELVRFKTKECVYSDLLEMLVLVSHTLYVNSVSLLYRNLSKSLTVFTLFIREVRIFVSYKCRLLSFWDLQCNTYLLYHVKVFSLIGDFAP